MGTDDQPSSERTSFLEAQLLGPPEFFWQGELLPIAGQRLRHVLAYLTLAGPTAREDLGDVLWPGRGSQSVRQAIFSLRAMPGAVTWLREGPQVSLQVVSDVQRLEALARQAAPPSPEVLEAWDVLPLLGSLALDQNSPFAEWLTERRLQCVAVQVQAMKRWGAACLREKQLEQARLIGQVWQSLDPLDEEAVRLVLDVAGAAGQIEEARDLFERWRQRLERTLGATPDAQTVAALQRAEGRSANRHARALLLGAEALTGPPSEAAGDLYGRQDALAQAEHLLAHRGRVVLHGLAGIGKTRLATELAHQMIGSPEALRGQVLWFSVGQDEPGVAVSALVEPLGLRLLSGVAPDAGGVAAALTKHQVCGVILDDAWNILTLQQLLAMLPATLPVVVTSRHRMPGLPHVGLDRLSRHAAQQLVCGDAPQVSEHDLELDALCALLGDHPYALRLAALSLGQDGLTLSALLTQLQGAPHLYGASESVSALLRQSVQALDTVSYEAFLGCGSMLAPTVTADLLALALRRTTEEVETALYTLVQRGLLSRESQAGSDQVRYRMHDLTWAAARSHEALLPHTVQAAVLNYAAGQTQHPALLDLERASILAALIQAREQGDTANLLALLQAWLGGPYIAARGFPVAHLDLLQAGIQAAHLARNWKAAGQLWGKLGDIQQGLLTDHQSAIASYQQAERYAGQAGQRDRQAVFCALAGTLLAMNRLPGADAALETALGHARASGDVLCQARVLEQQGFVQAMQGHFLEASTVFAEAREMLRLCLAEGHPQRPEAQSAYINVTSNLGQCRQRLGELEEAVQLKREVLALAQERDEQLRIANAHADLGELHGLQGDSVAAHEQLMQAIGLYRALNASGQEAAARNLLNALPARA